MNEGHEVKIDAQLLKRIEDNARARGITTDEAIKMALDAWLKKKLGIPN